ncbi:MAG TPA: DUF6766 family protein [Intrasporangium sp.]|uniref:DUF6766 family protein n=1 Tax=Intrasporangium sp. TaxID=1925024 RepID=UPI002B47D2AC|nr:DUF6766 family protein [Intrasporangium sp.]HKX66566.1 DUF6766 family protein [Intrasporangium sp.]
MATSRRIQAERNRSHNSSDGKPRFPRAYSFGLVTAGLFVFSWVGQFVTQLVVERNDAAEHGQEFSMSEFWPQFFASTFENWQSEFLQLLWQAAGLSLLLFWGSSQSREQEERIEAKLDRLLEEQGIESKDISKAVNESL